MKRSPLKRTPFKSKGNGFANTRRRINPVSKKRKVQQTNYSKLRKEYLVAYPRCQCCTTAPSTEIHHRRGRFKSRLNEIEFWLAICRPCHDRIHHNPAWAYEKGLLIQR